MPVLNKEILAYKSATIQLKEMHPTPAEKTVFFWHVYQDGVEIGNNAGGYGECSRCAALLAAQAHIDLWEKGLIELATQYYLQNTMKFKVTRASTPYTPPESIEIETLEEFIDWVNQQKTEWIDQGVGKPKIQRVYEVIVNTETDDGIPELKIYDDCIE